MCYRFYYKCRYVLASTPVLLLGNTFERLAIRLDVHKTPCFCVSLGEAMRFRILELGPIFDRTLAVIITSISCHKHSS